MRTGGSYDPIVFQRERGKKGTMQPLTLEYIAGFVDGEGSFTILKIGGNCYLPRFAISNTDLDVLEDIRKFLCISTKIYKRYPKNSKWKIAYCLTANSLDECKSIAMLLEPYLRIKKGQAQIIMQYPRAHPPYQGSRLKENFSTKSLQLKLRNRIMLLNKTGPPDQESDEDLQQEPDPQGSLFNLKQKEVNKP
ncbi:hypothetical protein ES703_85373 [subsurface metagenome]